MPVPSHLPRQRRVLMWLWGSLFLLSVVVSAQQGPVSAYRMAYTTIDDNTLYIQGGMTVPESGGLSYNTTQFYSLDLTQTGWDTSSPPWKALTYPTRLASISPTYGHSISVAPDSRTFTIWVTGPTLLANYSIRDDTWSEPLASPPKDAFSGLGLKATTDPTTGIVYIPGAGSSYNNMTIYTISTGATTSSFLPTTLVGVQISYSFTWCQSKKAFMLFTGDATTVNPFFEYIPSSGQWTNMASSGAIPTFRLRSCMLSAYNGTKMLLFGGDTGSASVATLSILDVKTMEWSKAKDAPDTRSDMACSVSGDNFIVWGGYKKNIADVIIGVPTTPLIYNLVSGEWTTKYVRSNSHNPTESGEPSNVTNNGDKTRGGVSKSIAAAIGGGVAGGLAVIAVIAFLTARRRRQKRGQDYNDTKHTKAISQYDPAPPSMEHTYDAPVSTAHLQGKPIQQLDIINNPQYAYIGSPQSEATSPPSTGSPNPPPPSSLIPARPNFSGIPRSPQDHIQQLQYELARSQKQLAIQTRSNPKYDPNALPTTEHTGLRGPQGAGEPSTAEHPRLDQHELIRKIEVMQAELQDLQAQLKLS